MEHLLEEERYHIPFLFVFSLLLYLSFLGHRDLWAPVEPRYGEIVRVMFSRGEWIVPTVNGQLYTDKPILYFWLALAFSHLLGGVNEWTIRLPSALASVGLTLVTYRMGKEFFSPRTGFLAALVLATSARAVWEGRWAHTDMLFTFFCTASVYLLLRAWHQRYREAREKRVLWAYALMGLATLTKGLIGFVLPGLVFLCLLLLMGDRQKWRRLRLFQGLWVFLFVTAPWFIAVSLSTEGRWISDFFWIHHVQRYLSGLGHREPFYYYLVNFPLDFLPWTIFFVVAVIAYWPERGLPLRPVPLSLAVWFIVVFLFFSLSDTKRGLYLLPLYPPAALWVAQILVGLERQGGRGTLATTRVITGLFLGALVLGAASAPFVLFRVRPDLWVGSMPLAAVIILGAGFAFRAFRKNRCGAGSVWLAVTVLGGILSNGLWIFPVIDQYKSPRIMASKVQERLSASDPLYIYADRMNNFNYYLGREVIPVLSRPEEVARLRPSNGLPYLLIRDRDVRRMPGAVAQRWESVVEGATGSKKWRLWRLKRARPSLEETPRGM